MDRPNLNENSAGWNAFVWISFALSQIAVLVGVYHLPTDFWIKGYMAIGLLFCTGSSFTLAKTARDNHEAKKLINRVSEVKTERMLQDYELKQAMS